MHGADGGVIFQKIIFRDLNMRQVRHDGSMVAGTTIKGLPVVICHESLYDMYHLAVPTNVMIIIFSISSLEH